MTSRGTWPYAGEGIAQSGEFLPILGKLLLDGSNLWFKGI
ncbi:MAG: hypothetical protein QOI06_2329 [Nocardioidaceae bacterium]|jgi:hypothetical protein|nr:hypothetical protein [Nocardioidaceae bacterium]